MNTPSPVGARAPSQVQASPSTGQEAGDHKYDLSQERADRARARARARIEEELRARDLHLEQEAEQRFLEDETLRLRREAGLTTPADDVIEYTINSPPSHTGHIRDGRRYHQGQTYLLPRKVVECMREDDARAWDGEDRAGNPHKKFYRREYAARGGLTQNPFGLYERDGENFVFGRAGINGASGKTVGAPSDDPVDAVVRALR